MNNNLSLSSLLRLMRPKHWIKNAFVLAPLMFAGEFTNIVAIENAMVAFVLFCLASSATYVLNDYIDIESDRKHAKKSKKRP